jgi:hypothetical protein
MHSQGFMRIAATLVAVLVAVPTVASAGTSRVGGMLLTIDPDSEPDNGVLAAWLAYSPGAFYVGGEIALGNATAGNEDGSLSYHAIVGGRARISPRVNVLVDVGLGISQQFDVQLGILGGESGSDTKAFAPSAAARVHLVGMLGTVGSSELGVALTGDSRTTLDDNAAPAIGLGLGVFITR